MIFDECVIDASMGVRGGMLCFCPVERNSDGEITSVIVGANFLGAPPVGSKVVAVVHEGGQEAVEEFCREHRELIAEFIQAGDDAQAIDARSGETPKGVRSEGRKRGPEGAPKGGSA